MNRPTTRVLCVDDHAFLIEGLCARFEHAGDFRCVGRLDNAERLIPEVRRLQPEIVVLDIEMPGPDPFDSADTLRRIAPAVRVVFLSAHVRDHYIHAAIEAGAAGYFAKSDEPEEILEGMRRIAQGRVVFGSAVQARLRTVKPGQTVEPKPASTRLDGLSPRELQILRMIGRGLSRAEIAREACISPKTVDNHRESIMTKLDIHDRAMLVRFSIAEGVSEV